MCIFNVVKKQLVIGFIVDAFFGNFAYLLGWSTRFLISGYNRFFWLSRFLFFWKAHISNIKETGFFSWNRTLLWCLLFYKENVALLQGALKKLLTNPLIMKFLFEKSIIQILKKAYTLCLPLIKKCRQIANLST